MYHGSGPIYVCLREIFGVRRGAPTDAVCTGAPTDEVRRGSPTGGVRRSVPTEWGKNTSVTPPQVRGT